jgi:hypothetical protein
LFTSTGRTAPSSSDPEEKVLIRTSKPYQSLVNKIETLGGKVTQQYKYVDAIAAEIPRRLVGDALDCGNSGNDGHGTFVHFNSPKPGERF